MTNPPQRPSPRTTSRSSVRQPAYWFRARPSGLGWDWPLCWQGWLSYALALTGIITGTVLFPPTRSHAAFMASNIGVVVLMLCVCALKWEPLPR